MNAVSLSPQSTEYRQSTTRQGSKTARHPGCPIREKPNWPMFITLRSLPGVNPATNKTFLSISLAPSLGAFSWYLFTIGEAIHIDYGFAVPAALRIVTK